MDVNFNEVARLHVVWRNMKDRCLNPKNKQFSDYGGRGINITPDWLDFHEFATWALSNGSDKSLHLDRKDNDGCYEPENCRFVTPTVNARNKRNNVHIDAFGERKTAGEWEEDPRCVVTALTVRRRVRMFGWDPEEAITVKFRRNRQSMSCASGHPLTEDNVYRRSDSDFRVCKTCAKRRAMDAYWNNKNKDGK